MLTDDNDEFVQGTRYDYELKALTQSWHALWKRKILTYMGGGPITGAFADYRRADLGEGALACPNDDAVNLHGAYLDGGYGLNYKGLNSSTYGGSPRNGDAGLFMSTALWAGRPTDLPWSPCLAPSPSVPKSSWVDTCCCA